MILERVLVTVGDNAGFEKVFAEAKQVIAKSPGFLFIDLLQGIEQPDTYQLLIGWETLEDHTVRFRESELSTRWRELLVPFYTAVPEVLHYDPRGERYTG